MAGTIVIPPSVPVRSIPPRVARGLSVALIPLVVVAAGVGLLVPGVYHDNSIAIPMQRANDLVNLVVAVPLLIGSLVLVARGSVRGSLLWLGTVGWLAYVGAIDAFSLQFNALFLVYVAIFGLSTYALILGLGTLDPDIVARSFRRRLPTGWIGGYLIVASILTALLWLSDIVPALLAGQRPQAIAGRGIPVEPTHVLDLGILLPASILAGILVLRHHSWGYVLASFCLTLLVPLLIAVNVAPIFQLAAGQSLVVGPVVSYAVILVVNLGMTWRYLLSQNPDGFRE